MPRGGWIKLWRKAWDCKISPRRRRLPYTEFEAWLDLLCRAVQDPEGTTVKNPGKMPVKLGPGEVLYSLRGLQEDWRWGSPNKVQRFITSLCTLEMLEKTEQKPSRLKVVNAELYGLVRNKNRLADGTATEQRRNSDGTLQEVEEVKEVQEEKELPLTPPAAGRKKAVSPDRFLKTWNAAAGRRGWRKMRLMSPDRKTHLRARCGDKDWVENWEEALRKTETLPFANGKGSRGWMADPEWFLRPGTVNKILEGKYEESGKGTRDSEQSKLMRDMWGGGDDAAD